MRTHLSLMFFCSVVGACSNLPIDDLSQFDQTLDKSAAAYPHCSEADPAKIWRPAKGASWDWQLTSPVDINANVDVYDIDGFLADSKLIASLHAKGRKVVCYINVGAWENWRPDAKVFPTTLLGKQWSSTRYQDERWLDIRRIDQLKPLLGARFDMAKAKGCDAIEPDNLDGFVENGEDRTGFKLTYDNQLTFNRFVACEAHRRGLSVALKNDPHQAKDLQPDFDFVVSEQCFDYDECNDYKPFLDAGKAVLETEYSEDLGSNVNRTFKQHCDKAQALGMSTILKKNALDKWRQACPVPSR